MRCIIHQSDFSSTVGVCASCLRERLSVLIAAQSQAHHQLACSRAAVDPPPPLDFPSSVSPYVSRRKSDDANSHRRRNNHHHHLHRFFSTPQVGPTYTAADTAANPAGVKKQSRFSMFSNLFRSRSVKHNQDHKPRVSTRESSWFYNLLSIRRKKQSNTGNRRNPSQIIDRGISPSRTEIPTDDFYRSPSGSGYSSDASQNWKKTPVTGPPSTARRGRTGHRKTTSGLTFCLSPLVRASPNRQWNQKGGLPPDLAFSGEVRVPVKPNLSVAASFKANRSRKLADFGRANNR